MTANEINTTKTNLDGHIANKTNPHSVTSTQIIGLEYVNNTSDANKPVSNALQAELDKKINVSDVVNNVTTNDANKVLSANQGKLMNDKITALSTRITAAQTNV